MLTQWLLSLRVAALGWSTISGILAGRTSRGAGGFQLWKRMGKSRRVIRQNKLQHTRKRGGYTLPGLLVLCVLLLTGCGGRVAASADAGPDQTWTVSAPVVITPVPEAVESAPLAIAPGMRISSTPAATITPSGGDSPLAVPAGAAQGFATPTFMDREAISIVTARAAQRARMGFLAPASPPSTGETAPGESGEDAPISPLAPPAGGLTVVVPAAEPVGTPDIFLPALPHAGPADTTPSDTSASETGASETGAPVLPTPTPRPNLLHLAELLQQPVPGAPENPDPAATPIPAAPEPTAPVSEPAPEPAAPAVDLPPPVPLQPTPVWSQANDGAERTVRVPIFMYHYLSDPPPGADIYRVDLSVSPARFGAHLDALRANGYTTISLYQLYAHLTQGVPLPERPVVLTFDDGYRDNYVNAFPQLRDRGMVATFFLNTDFINDGLPAYLTWDMVREMYAGGMSIEAHGRNHTSLKDRDVDYLVWQALGNLEAIEQEVGVRPRFISYPAGQYDQLTIDIFASANYWMGVTTIQGATHTSDRLFELRRVRVRNTTTADELLRLAALDW